jgi:quercetin dioxygenase-like cupin family protein
MYKYSLTILALVFISCSGSKPKMLLPEKVSPDVYEVLLDNETVKVMKVSFAPGQSDNMHDHYPFTFHLLDGGEAQVTMPDGTINERQIPGGFTGHNGKGVRHQVKNIGPKELNIILIEHKKLESMPPFSIEESFAPNKVSPEIYELVHEDEKIKIYLASFDAGKSDKVHEHGPNTAYIIKGGTVKVVGADGSVSERSFPDGAVSFSNNVVRHQVENIGSTDIKVLIAEYK